MNRAHWTLLCWGIGLVVWLGGAGRGEAQSLARETGFSFSPWDARPMHFRSSFGLGFAWAPSGRTEGSLGVPYGFARFAFSVVESVDLLADFHLSFLPMNLLSLGARARLLRVGWFCLSAKAGLLAMLGWWPWSFGRFGLVGGLGLSAGDHRFQASLEIDVVYQSGWSTDIILSEARPSATELHLHIGPRLELRLSKTKVLFLSGLVALSQGGLSALIFWSGRAGPLGLRASLMLHSGITF